MINNIKTTIITLPLDRTIVIIVAWTKMRLRLNKESLLLDVTLLKKCNRRLKKLQDF